MADGLYRDVLSQGYHGLPGSAFTRVDVQVKTFSARAWIYLPGESLTQSGANPATAAGAPRASRTGRRQPAAAERFLGSKATW